MTGTPLVLGSNAAAVPSISVKTNAQYLVSILTPDTIIHGRLMRSGGFDAREEANSPTCVVDFRAGVAVSDLTEHIAAGLYMELGH